MIITFKINAPINEVKELKRKIENFNIKVIDASSEDLGVFGLIGNIHNIDIDQVACYNWIINIIRITENQYMTSKSKNNEKSVVKIKDVEVGGNNTIIIAGPCSIENENQYITTCQAVKDCGGHILRGGIYKPRTSPYVFQGLGKDALPIIKKTKSTLNMPIVSEITSISQIQELENVVDAFQVGARNMQNFELLKALGKTNKPIILKRGFANTIEEWLMSAEYIMVNGNSNIILCERGIRTFETMTRNTLDLSVITIIKQKTHLPIIIDPSHATGHWELVESISLAAIACGVDGLMIEVHNKPECALSDGGESLNINNFHNLMIKAKKLSDFMNKPII